jgi:hypothetical protein
VSSFTLIYAAGKKKSKRNMFAAVRQHKQRGKKNGAQIVVHIHVFNCMAFDLSPLGCAK